MVTDNLVRVAEQYGIAYKQCEAMALHTSFKLGGPADVLLKPSNLEQLKVILSHTKREGIPCFVLGSGSNLLVSDKGIDGAVIAMSALNGISIVGDGEIMAQAGVSLAALCCFARDNGLTGLEFAYGIPGSVGGAIYMNAGAYGGEMSHVVTEVTCLDGNLNELVRSGAECEFGYRESVYRKNSEIIESAVFKLKHGDKSKIAAEMETIINKRKLSQPLDFPSAGSTFKRPDGYFAAALIDECGLKGRSVGGAEVSTKHAGFVINKNRATCSDVLGLIDVIKATVKEKKNVDLETEVIFVGR